MDALSLPRPRLLDAFDARLDLDERRTFDLALVLTLVLVLLYVDGTWLTTRPAAALAVAALVAEPLRRSAYLWFLTGTLLLAGAAARWATADNHQYLIAYWCLAVACALHARQPVATLRRIARRLIGLCFLFAVVWKAASPDFRDGTFFHYTLLTDDRFAIAAELGAGVDPEARRHNEAASRALTNFDSHLTRVALRDGPATAVLARAMTAWTLAIEGLVALAFLTPARGRLGGLSRRRDPFLLAFVASTYALAPVLGFGWVLLVMGLVQADDEAPRLRWAYAGLFVALQLYALPWQQIAGRLAIGR